MNMNLKSISLYAGIIALFSFSSVSNAKPSAPSLESGCIKAHCHCNDGIKGLTNFQWNKPLKGWVSCKQVCKDHKKENFAKQKCLKHIE